MSEIKDILSKYKTIAMIGVSKDPTKTSTIVMKYMQKYGYKVIPVNPSAKGEKILGENVYEKITDIKEPIDIVDVFRPSKEAFPIAEDTVKIGAKVLWLQLGIRDENAKKLMEKNNIDYTIIRPTDVIGSRNKSFLNLVRILNKGYFFYLGDHNKTITNYVTLSHVCHCIIYFIENTKRNDYIVNEPVKLKDIIVIISKTLKINTPVYSIPKLFGFFFSFLCDFIQIILNRKIPYNSEKFSELTNKTKFSCDKLFKDTGIKNQYPLLNEIRDLTNYYIKNKFL